MLLTTGVDKAALLAQLNEGKFSEFAKGQNASELKVETFPLLLPRKESKFQCVTAYSADAESSAYLQVNTRANELVWACGFVRDKHQFRGDVFFSRVLDNEEVTDVRWARVDLALSECTSDALWVQQTKAQQVKTKAIALASAMDHLALHKGYAGETEAYTWRQTPYEMEVTFKQGLKSSDAQLVKTTFGSTNVKVDLKGEVLLQGRLLHLIDPDDSTWTISDGVLQLTLMKKTPGENWEFLLRDQDVSTSESLASHPQMQHSTDPLNLGALLLTATFLLLGWVGLRKVLRVQKLMLESQTPLMHNLQHKV
eukprot:gnl/MRDRNA2_/MRDRNA2_56991_c0_seq1.p1 gnl/MRDRNA2_/MRDRNA2_56991_c0~~gnl/MRDRNA2_/MRDRNA2_56991_c0_seq1.p1  ORF type:complete len:311 (-),score=49.67 gnl/MRDRNA2_/MRDRNA2_56991_c0_seq1:55-987(-)